MSFLRPILKDWQWPLAAIAVSAFMLAAAHGFETFGKLYPCPLCLRQREVYWALIAMTVTGLVLWKLRPKRRFLVALNVLIGLVFGVGTVVAAYHSGVEWGIFPPPTGCAGDGPVDLMNIGDLDKPMLVPSCTDAPFYVAGLSMAGWNGVISAVLALASFFAAAATFRGRETA
ncbi:MAG: disulfide bond formation protein B [Hyphomonas sp.]|nr:disulfide bond formation protein B [Hyphomonas sp.]